MEKNRLIRWVLRFGPALTLMVMIYWLSSTPSSDLPNFGGWDLFVKKMSHITAYTLLGISYLRMFQSSERKFAWLALGLAILYAASDEVHQSYVSGRNATGVDVLIDMVGAVFGIYFATQVVWLKKMVESKLPG